MTTADFQFHIGNDDTPEDWDSATAPTSITVRPGAGTNNSDRITVTWPDNTIGECGNSTTDAKVTAIDMLAARDNQRHFLEPAPVDFDFDRNARVNKEPGRHSAHDAVLENIFPCELQRPEDSSSKLTWLYKYEQINTKHRRSHRQDPSTQTVETLLASL